MRTSFIQSLIKEARKRPDLFLIVGDLGYSVVEPFAEEFPDRFLNAGVAEQNMTGLAAGMASEGYHVFTYSIANFPTTRCLEQIRNDVCYHRLPVTVVAVGGGLAYGSLGYSHHAVQDYALMRSLPGMRVVAPGDPLETSSCLEWICKDRGPSYLRLGKAGEPVFHVTSPEIESGGLVIVRKVEAGSQNLLLTTGAALGTAIAASELLAKKGQNWTVAALPVWSDSVKSRVVNELSNFRQIISAEDHLVAGGFGSFLREAFGNDPQMQSRLKTLSLGEWVCGEVGSQSTLNASGGLSVESLVGLALETV